MLTRETWKRALLATAAAALVMSSQHRPAQAQGGGTASITGTVKSEDGKAIEFAEVVLTHDPTKETQVAMADARGEFAFSGLAFGGPYSLSVTFAGFRPAAYNQILLKTGEARRLAVVLQVAVTEEVIVVRAQPIDLGVADLLAERRESVSVDEVIGVEEMSRSGDSDAGAALKRVTGLTLVGGQFIYVRGMGERYSNTLLNGQAIPSPEPERRVIPLDLFPTDVLESVVIQKSPSADTPAELGGGVVQLRTRTLPEKFTAGVELSTGLVTNATFRDRPTYDGSGTDFMGTDNGARELPGQIRRESPLREGNRFQEGFSKQELAELARLLPNNYNVEDSQVPVNTGVSVKVGDKRKLLGIPAGFLLSGSWGNDYSFREEEYTGFNGSDLRVDNDFVIRELSQTVGTSGILVLGAEPAKGHEVKATTLLLRITDNQTGVTTGYENDLQTDIQQYRLQFVERQLLTQQVAGEHTMPRLADGKLEWAYAYSRATRDEPDRREYFYADALPAEESEDFLLSTRPAGNQRIWSDLTDQIHDVGLDYTQPFPVWSDLKARVKVGGKAVLRDREYDTIRLTLRASPGISAEMRRLAPEDIWSEGNLNGESGWFLEDVTQPTDSYTAEQEIEAGYAMTTIPITSKIELTAGARVERSRQRVDTFGRYEPEEVAVATEIDDTDVLPSAAARVTLGENLVLRATYGRTVSRPDFREMSPNDYRDVLTATRFVGNPNLRRAVIDNVDGRLEYYFSSDELVSLGGFFKYFDSPIEQVDESDTERSITWDNAKDARNYGVELEGRRRLGFVHDVLVKAYVAGNVALIKSEVSLGANAAQSTSKDRALQGQSPYVVNAQIGYDDARKTGITAALLYNVFGRRIRGVGRYGTPDIFEEPYHQLDFVYGQRLGDHWQIKLKAKNLLDRDVEFHQGDEIARRYKVGRFFGLSVGWEY